MAHSQHHTTETSFDTHKYYKKLVGAGLDKKIAEFLSEDRLSLITTEFATKTDLRELKNELIAKINTQGKELSTKIDAQDIKIEAQGRELTAKIDALNDKVDAQGKELSAKIDAQGKELSAKIDAQGKELSAKIDVQDKDLNAKIDSLSWKLTIRLGSIVAGAFFLTVAILGFILRLPIPVAG